MNFAAPPQVQSKLNFNSLLPSQPYRKIIPNPGEHKTTKGWDQEETIRMGRQYDIFQKIFAVYESTKNCYRK